VSGLTAHLLSECDCSSDFVQCYQCFEAIHSKHYQQHMRDKSCPRMSMIAEVAVLVTNCFNCFYRPCLNTCQLFLAVRLSNMNQFQYRLVGMSWNKHLTKLCVKCLLYLKYMLALPWEVWCDGLSHQRSTYMYNLMNHWITTTTTCSQKWACSKSHHFSIIYLKCPFPAHTKISDVNELKRCIKNE